MPRPSLEFVKSEANEGEGVAPADNNDDDARVPPVDAPPTEPETEMMDFEGGVEIAVFGGGNNLAEAEPSGPVSTGQIQTVTRRISLPALTSDVPSYSYSPQVQSSLSSGQRRSSFPIPTPIPSSSSSSLQIRRGQPSHAANSSTDVAYLFEGLDYTVRPDITYITFTYFLILIIHL